jgi:hypothetical protein
MTVDDHSRITPAPASGELWRATWPPYTPQPSLPVGDQVLSGFDPLGLPEPLGHVLAPEAHRQADHTVSMP